jgi:hypothetical protein
MDISSDELLEQNAILVKSAETIISNALSKPVNIASMILLAERGGRSMLYRCFTSNGGVPAESFVIKKVGGTSFTSENLNTREARVFLNDWVGEEFLSSLHLENPVSPSFYGGDLSQGFFVLEDLGEHRSLVEPLLHGDALNAETALVKYWTCLGSMHAATAGKAGRYETMYYQKSPGQRRAADEFHELESRMKSLQVVLEQHGVPVNSMLSSEIQAVVEAVSQPRIFQAYIHADPCPDNVFDLGDRYRLIDFEFSRFGHALQDAVYPRMLWPSCWCANRLPEEVVLRVENRYRSELVRGIPEAEWDAVWETGLVDACGMTVLATLGWALEKALKEDLEWGLATGRQRIISQLEAFIKTSEDYHKLPALRGASEQLLTMLRSRWAEIPPLPLYPAFRTPRVE